MGVSTPAAPRANGAATVLNVLVSPREAYEALRAAPTWGWAYLIAVALTLIGQYLVTPASLHAVQAGWPAQVAANPSLAGMSAAQQQNALNVGLAFVRWLWLIAPVSILVGALIQTVIMMVFKAIGKGEATFKQLWAASMNTIVVGLGVYSVVAGLLAMVRGASTFNSTADLIRVVPGPAWFVSGAPVKVVAFLAAFNIISIWGAILLAVAMVYVARVSKVTGAACAIVTSLLAALYFSLSIR